MTEQELNYAAKYAYGWVQEWEIPISKADLLVIKRRYLPLEIEIARLDKDENRKYLEHAALSSLRRFCHDFGLEEYVKLYEPT